MAIKINTGAVSTAATQIAKINQNINNDFSMVESAMNTLNRSWDGGASDNAIRKYQNIKNNYYQNRYNVIQQLVNFMRKQAGEGYEKTEQAIQSAAAAFK